MGTWQMPLRVPPARVALTSRSVAGAASLTEWIQKNPDLLKASNGLRPEIFGKVSIYSSHLASNPIYYLHFFSTSKMPLVMASLAQQGEPLPSSVLACQVLLTPKMS